MSGRRPDSSFNLGHIAPTTRPSSLTSGPGSGQGSVCVDAGDTPTIVSMLMNRPRHPAFRRFTGVGVDGGGFGGFGACTCTFTTKGVSYRACAANACCFAPSNVDVDVVVAERKAREGIDVREVVVPCERIEDRSEMEVRAKGWRERGRGGYGCGVATAAAEGGMEWGRDPSRVCQRAGRTACRGRACEDRRVYAGDGGGRGTLQGGTAHGASGGKTDAGTAWADTLRAEVGVAAAWLPRRARAF